MTIETIFNNFPDDEEKEEEEEEGYFPISIQDKLESNEDFFKYRGTVPIP